MFDQAGTASRIRDLRGETPQRQFAEDLNYKQTYISEIETGKTKPSIEFLVVLSDTYKVTLDYLVTGRKVARVSTVNVLRFSQKLKKLHEDACQLDEEFNTS